MMSRKDVKYVNWPNLGVLDLCVRKSETRWESAIKRAFPMTSNVFDDVIHLRPYILILIQVESFLSQIMASKLFEKIIFRIYEYCFTLLSAQSWQYRDRRKPEAGTMPYSYFDFKGSL